MSLFHKVAFQKIDPLADGLGDEIALEMEEAERIELEEPLDAQSIVGRWNSILAEAENDIDWLKARESE